MSLIDRPCRGCSHPTICRTHECSVVECQRDDAATTQVATSTASKVHALQWSALPETLPPKDPENPLWSQRVWLAMPDGTVIDGECMFASQTATHGHPVHAWFANDTTLEDEPVAWMPFAVPDHPHALPGPEPLSR